jgi:hypothetical protein
MSHSLECNLRVFECPEVLECNLRIFSLPPAGKHDDDRDNLVHPTRALKFLVGLKGKSETMAIGGPWSPSLDGADPANDPSVLIKTAIREEPAFYLQFPWFLLFLAGPIAGPVYIYVKSP